MESIIKSFFIPIGKGSFLKTGLMRTFIMITALFFAIGSNNMIYATELQQVTVSGTVTDQKGAPMGGVTIAVKGTSLGTLSDASGKYYISNVPQNASLVFSFVGMKNQEIQLNGRTKIDVVLEEQAVGLDEVVVVGYGTMRRNDLTGSITSVNSVSLSKAVPISLTRVLQGKVAGVRITEKTGRPGEGVTIRVRGGNSVSGGNEPLYVVDGFPVESLGADFNSEDIASVDILKDASATAIYGSRGANGVVLITTKKGVSGKTEISYHGSYGVASLRKKIELLGKTDYVAMQNEIATKEGNPILTPDQIAQLPDNDWQDLTYQNAPIQTHQLSFTGGSDVAKFYSSVNYLDQTGIIIGSDFTRIGMRVNGDIKLSKKLTFRANFSYTNSKDHNGNFATDGWGAVPFQAIVMPPTTPIFDAAGKYTVFNGSPWGGTNPVGYTQMETYTTTLNRNVNNGEFSYEIIKGLSLRISAGIDFNNITNDGYSVIGISNGGQGIGDARKSMSKSYQFVNENIMEYSFNIKENHKFNAMAGMTYQSYVFDQVGGSATGFVTDVFADNNISSGTKPNPPTSTYSDNKLISYLGRINYSIFDKYLLTLSGRYDGSSKFGKDNKFAFFPSAALAWKISEEDFMKQVSWISDLKVRASIGTAGNQAIAPYQTLDRLSTNIPIFGTGQGVGFVSSGFANESLMWETTKQIDVGIDLDLFKDRIGIIADYYKKNTTNLLINATLPPSSGYSSSTRNVGEIQNQGFEFSVSYKTLTGQVRSETSLNMTINRSIVKDLGTDIQGNKILRVDAPIGGGNWFPLFLGKTPFELYSYLIDGIYQTDAEALAREPGSNKKAGDYKWADVTKDGIINSDDKTIVSHLEPKFIFGINETVTYKGFELAFQIVGSYGNQIANEFNKYYTALGGKWNVTKEAWDNRWTGPGSTGTFAASSSNVTSYLSFGDPSSLWMEPGSYLRFKDLRLTYYLPESALKMIKAKGLSVYVSGLNLITLTNYPHYDPEASWTSSAVNGWDRGVYPSSKTIMGGVQVTF